MMLKFRFIFLDLGVFYLTRDRGGLVGWCLRKEGVSVYFSVELSRLADL